MEWYPEYWKMAKPYNNHPGTISQWLEAPTDDRTMTLEEFKEIKPEIVIASYNDHVEPYNKLIKRFNPKAKLIHQRGNEWPVSNTVKNLLSSTSPFPTNANVVWYHQEFPLDIYKYVPPTQSKYIRSFVNILRTGSIFQQDWIDFQELEKLSKHKFESYGSLCRDGVVQGDEKIAKLMAESYFGVQLKHGGDGYGHTIHQWASIGRPLIYRGSQYNGKLAEKLLEHTVTGFDLDEMSYIDVVKYIKSLTPGSHREMCEAMNNKFKQIDFDKETNEIKKFMEELI